MLINVSDAANCGLTSSVPKGPFTNVTDTGTVLFVQKLGDIPLNTVDKYGKKEEIPVFLKFNSDQQRASQFAGYGWFFPLLEANVIQIDENTFLAEMPNGWRYTFKRKKDNPNILSGSGGWIGEISDARIKLTAPCGASVVFVDGKIQSFSLTNGTTFYISRSSDSVALSNGNKEIVSINRESSRDYSTLKLGGVEFYLYSSQRPLVESNGKLNVVTKMVTAISKIESAKQTLAAFDYSLTPELNYRLQITGKNGSPEELIWDPKDKKLIKDSLWTYKTTQSGERGESTRIDRKRIFGGRSEYWMYNKHVDKYEKMDENGVLTKIAWYTSGILDHKMRSLFISERGKTLDDQKYSYDEKGRLFRETLNGDTFIYSYPGDSLRASGITRMDSNGKQKEMKLMNENGVTTYWFKNGSELFYDAFGKLQSVRKDGENVYDLTKCR